jgi:hypothetical protein
MSRTLAALVAALSVAVQLAAPPAQAASPYDGIWVVDFPPSDLISGEGEYVCPALRLRADVKDGSISGSLLRFQPGNVVENATIYPASPVTGMVHADGSLVAYWLGWIVKGQITGDRADLTLVFGQCGPRHMTGVRVQKE